MRRAAWSAALFAALLASPAARADEAAAKVHFRRGVELYDKKAFKEALAEFQAAYVEKPSPGIKQNVALCLEGLGDAAGAATSFDEALDEGKDTLKPETKAAIKAELDKLAGQVATITVKVLGASDGKPLDGATIFLDKKALAPGAARRPIRTTPGIHDLGAHVDGYADPQEKRLGLVAGSPVDATFDLAVALGAITIRPNVEGAVVKIDGVEVGKGGFSGKLTAGAHRIEVAAPDFLAATSDVVITAGAALDYPVVLRKPGEAPPVYAPPAAPPPPPPPKRIYVAVGLGADTEKLHFSQDLGEDPGGGSRDLGGLSVSARGGYKLTPLFAPELYVEIARLGLKYKIHDGDAVESSASATLLMAAPSLRFTTPGHIRFTTALGFGLHSTALSAQVPVANTAATTTKSGAGLAFAALFDLGIQFDVGPVWLEAALLFDLNGIGPVRDDATADRMLEDSPAFHSAIRLGLGIPF